MANRYAVATGNWSNPAIWDGGTLPTVGDDVRTNSYTVTIDQNIDVASIQNTALAPAVAGGVFVINASGRTITADVRSGSATVLTYNGAFTLTIIGNIIANTSGVAVSSNNTGSVLTFIGNVSGGTGFGTHGISTSGALIMTGDCIGNTFSGNSNAVNLVGAAASATITGNVTGGNGGRGLDATGGATIVINGNITGGAGSPAIGQSGAVATIIVNGNITGGTINVIPGLYLGGGSLTGNFNVYGSNIGNGPGIRIDGGVAVVKQAFFSSIGTSPMVGRNIYFDNSTQIINILKQNNTSVNLVDINGADYPTANNVRNGVSYASGIFTGTLVVPASSTVTLGVVYDNGTTGTAQNTAAAFLTELSTSLDPLADRLRNVSTVDSTAATIAAFKV